GVVHGHARQDRRVVVALDRRLPRRERRVRLALSSAPLRGLRGGALFARRALSLPPRRGGRGVPLLWRRGLRAARLPRAPRGVAAAGGGGPPGRAGGCSRAGPATIFSASACVRRRRASARSSGWICRAANASTNVATTSASARVLSSPTVGSWRSIGRIL